MPPSYEPVVHIPSSTIVEGSGGQTNGMIRSNAIVNLASICGTVMVAHPHSASDVHHHGGQDTIVYAAKGHGTVISESGKKRQELKPGDFALIPKFVEHQEVNESDEEVVWIITRSGSSPVVENLKGWDTSEDPRQQVSWYGEEPM